MSLSQQGWLNVASGLQSDWLEKLRDEVFLPDCAGARCLLDHPLVRETAARLCRHLVSEGWLTPDSVAIQAIAFDKTPSTNWKVAWHQDLMFPVARPASAHGYAVPCEKEGVPYARPPVHVLEALTAVRLSLDPCDYENGPLRVAPGTHQQGILAAESIAEHVVRAGEVTCANAAGDLLLMKPLLLHASSQAVSPKHRRILHLVYHDGSPVAEPWHRAL